MQQHTGRFARVLNVEDMRRLARRKLPKAIFDYIDGAADDEVSRGRNRQQFDRWGLVQRSAVNVSEIDLTTSILNRLYSAPFGIGPTGLAALAWPKAETLLAQSAHRAGIPFCLSTVSSVRLEEVAKATPAPDWFQLYLFRDRGLSRDLLQRARAAGYSVLVITVDCPTGGNRERDPPNDFTLPVRATRRNVFDMARRPGWLWRMALNGAPKPENMVEAAAHAARNAQGLVAFMSSQLDASVTWPDVEEFAGLWDGPVVIKGLLSADDVLLARKAGADGVVLSNHGGRQLDGAVSPLHVLRFVRETVGSRMTLICDSGFRRGTDIIKALALGADGVLMGRNTLFGVGAGGSAGIDRVLCILRTEMERSMTLLGAANIAAISRHHVMDLYNPEFAVELERAVATLEDA